MDKSTFSKVMRFFAATWPDRSPTEDTLEAYWLALQHLDDDVFKQAAKRCLRECTFYPKPAEIISRAADILTIAGVLPSEPEAAWLEVQAAAKRYEWRPMYQPFPDVYAPRPGDEDYEEYIRANPSRAPWQPYWPDWSHAAIGDVVIELGGLERIKGADDKDLGFIRKEFIARYRVLRDRSIAADDVYLAQALPDPSATLPPPEPEKPAALGNGRDELRKVLEDAIH